MCIEQHFVALGGIRLQHKGSAGTQLQVCRQYLAPHTADEKSLLTPIELEGLPKFKSQRHKRLDQRLPTSIPPPADKLSDTAVVAVKPQRLDFLE